jgi:hypothetical protein
MAGLSQLVTYGYMIADAEHVEAAVAKHLAWMKAHGATDAELKQFRVTIAEAKRLVAAQKGGPTPLEVARQELKDLLGEFRAAARPVAVTINGVNAAAEKDLQVKGAFPNTDLTLVAFVDAVVPKLKSYEAPLIARGYTRAQQAALPEAGAKFKAAFAARGLERGEARAATLGRESVFKKLTTETTYFRTLGHESLRTSNERKDFDRVKVKKAPTAAQVAVKREAAAAKKLVVATKKSAKKAAAMAKKQGRTQPAAAPKTGT